MTQSKLLKERRAKVLKEANRRFRKIKDFVHAINMGNIYFGSRAAFWRRCPVGYNYLAVDFIEDRYGEFTHVWLFAKKPVYRTLALGEFDYAAAATASPKDSTKPVDLGTIEQFRRMGIRLEGFNVYNRRG